MSRRILLVVSLLVLLLTAACGQAANSTANPAAPTQIVVRILNLDQAQAALAPTEIPATPTPFPTFTPFPTYTPQPTQVGQVGGPTATPVCTNLIELVKHLTISDGTVLKGDTTFAKLWQVRNAGTCTWTTAYALIYAAGEQMGGPGSTPLQQEVPPGQTVDLRLDLISPHSPGVYTGGWMLQDANGLRFGLGPDGSQPLNLTIQIKPLPRPTPS